MKLSSLMFNCLLMSFGFSEADTPEDDVPEPLPTPVDARSAMDWNTRFSPSDGWIGGDGVYSVALSPEKTLWLFSDTFVGKVQDGRRTGATMVNNTVAIQDGHGDQAMLRFVVRRDVSGKPMALITPADGRGWFWLQAGFFSQGRLYLFLAQIERHGEGVFGFRQTGTWLGIVANPVDDPVRWKVDQKKVPHSLFSDEHFLGIWRRSFRRSKECLYLRCQRSTQASLVSE